MLKQVLTKNTNIFLMSSSLISCQFLLKRWDLSQHKLAEGMKAESKVFLFVFPGDKTCNHYPDDAHFCIQTLSLPWPVLTKPQSNTGYYSKKRKNSLFFSTVHKWKYFTTLSQNVLDFALVTQLFNKHFLTVQTCVWI